MGPRSFEDLTKLCEHRVALQQPLLISPCPSGTSVAEATSTVHFVVLAYRPRIDHVSPSVPGALGASMPHPR